jgi:putative inorganic carbon (hco3(-)) transporter
MNVERALSVEPQRLAGDTKSAVGAVSPSRPFVGVLAYLVFEYARLGSAYPVLGAFQLGKILVAVTLALFLANHVAFRSSERLSFDRIFWLFGAWLLLAALSINVAVYQPAAIDATINLGKWFITCYLIIGLVDTLPRFHLFLWVLLLLNFKLAQFQIRGFISGISAATNQNRFIREGIGAGSQGYFANGNDFGLAMAVVAPLAFFLVLGSKNLFARLAALALTATFVVALLRSGSRGAALGLGAAAALAWLYSKRRLLSGLLVLAFFAGFWTMAPDAWRDRFVNARNYEEDGTAASRIALWNGGIRMFQDHPLTGVGIDNFPVNWVYVYNTARTEGGAFAVHNIYIQAASELGIGGLLVVLAVLVAVFYRNLQTRRICRGSPGRPWRAANHFALALNCALLAFMVHGFFLTVLYYPHLFVIASMSIALHKIVEQMSDNRGESARAEAASS